MLNRTKFVKIVKLLRNSDSRPFSEDLVSAEENILQPDPFDNSIIVESCLFDPEWYARFYVDIAAAQIDPLTHYLQYGLKEGRNPNPLFDCAWYLKRYPDVAIAEMHPLVHYAQYGCNEGRDPHPLFSTLFYLERNPEVAETGLNALAHYLRVGMAAGRLAFDPNGLYLKHVLAERQHLAVEIPDILRHIGTMLYRPVFKILIDGQDAGARAETVASIERQVYDKWTVGDVDWRVANRERLDADTADYVIFLRSGELLNERALYDFADAINADPAIEIAYADEDVLDGDVRRAPFYKPDWSPDLIESMNYFGPAACFATPLISTIWTGASNYYDLVLRATERTACITHVRAVSCHRPRGAADPISPADRAADIGALAGRLKRTGRSGAVTSAVDGYGCYDLTVEPAAAPLVSVIIPTAGQVTTINGERVDLIFNCLDAIEQKSSYKNLEFVIVDNGDLGAERAQALLDRGCRLVTFEEKKFNVSKKLNLGAAVATGEMLLLLNDDIEPLMEDWIERLLEHFEKPHVGVVGAKLLYPDLKLQHVGVATNQGNPEHLRRMHPADDRGYHFSTSTARNFSAVTGACMMARTDVYRQLGGYNESLAISYNDVDFCFKIREAGLTVVYAPRAQLIHFESQSRAPVLDLQESAYFHERWAHMLTSDPFYNEENLEGLPGSFEVKHNPRYL